MNQPAQSQPPAQKEPERQDQKRSARDIEASLTMRLQLIMDNIAPGGGDRLGQELFEDIRDYIDLRVRKGK